MKILFITNQIPFPPDNGVRIVSHHAMRLMHDAGHELALAVLTEESDNIDLRFKIASDFCQNGMTLLTRLPQRNRLLIQFFAILKNRLFFIERYRNTIFRKELKVLIDRFKPDVIHFDLIPMTQYYDLIPLDVGTIASINDSYALTLENSLSIGYYSKLSKLYRKIQLRQTSNYESTTYQNFDAVHTMTEIDACYLRKLNPKIKTTVISNGIDPSLTNITSDTYGYSDVIFVANLVAENLVYLQHFLEKSWPIVLDKCPDAKLHVVGKLNPEAMALKAQGENIKGVIFLGYVECLADAYRGCGISIVPVNKNCGIVNKAIEAMAAGLAVIGFNKTFTGIKHAHKDEHFIAVADYICMGHAVVDLIQDDLHRKKIQQSAHQMAIKHYSWASRSKSYSEMYKDAKQNKSMC